MKMDRERARMRGGGDGEKGGKGDKSEQRRRDGKPEDGSFKGEERGRRCRSEAAYQRRGEVQE